MLRSGKPGLASIVTLKLALPFRGTVTLGTLNTTLAGALKTPVML